MGVCYAFTGRTDRWPSVSRRRSSEHAERKVALQNPGILGSIPVPASARFDLGRHGAAPAGSDQEVTADGMRLTARSWASHDNRPDRSAMMEIACRQVNKIPFQNNPPPTTRVFNKISYAFIIKSPEKFDDIVSHRTTRSPPFSDGSRIPLELECDAATKLERVEPKRVLEETPTTLVSPGRNQSLQQCGIAAMGIASQELRPAALQQAVAISVDDDLCFFPRRWGQLMRGASAQEHDGGRVGSRKRPETSQELRPAALQQAVAISVDDDLCFFPRRWGQLMRGASAQEHDGGRVGSRKLPETRSIQVPRATPNQLRTGGPLKLVPAAG
ncbi:hypothetical protein HPB47_006482 [Ixodes persulcatus]|uniref:Uncharacterized protein n=1 Tax=Ixodes persulcatus TaxID=34615 RepID=A0AC60PA79_IXOPE|nr:hypothetical protein HPB47_006482 [Ixodes persulcatus]